MADIARHGPGAFAHLGCAGEVLIGVLRVESGAEYGDDHGGSLGRQAGNFSHFQRDWNAARENPRGQYSHQGRRVAP